jgi:hypothetical protein
VVLPVWAGKWLGTEGPSYERRKVPGRLRRYTTALRRVLRVADGWGRSRHNRSRRIVILPMAACHNIRPWRGRVQCCAHIHAHGYHLDTAASSTYTTGVRG